MKLSANDAHIIVDQIFALYEKFGDEDYIGEPVSQLEHMSQAASLAKNEGYDDEVVLAAFFHDIGHLCADADMAGSMDGMGNVDHEELGADYLLKNGFSERIADLVRGHVIAKRYLTYKHPGYYHKLSPASKITLEFQGGVMTTTEAEEFEMNTYADLFIKLRYWDDEAKQTNLLINNVDQLKQLAAAHLLRHS